MGLLRSHLWNVRLEALGVLRYNKISGPNKQGWDSGYKTIGDSLYDFSLYIYFLMLDNPK